MGGDDRTRFPPGHEPIVQRRPGDLRQSVPVSPARPPRPPRLPAAREDDSTEPPGGKRPPVESFSSGAPRERLVEDGRFGELFVLFIINILLGIVTLGFYRFWGKTRIRKYIWSRTSFRGERFEYSGTGMELFLGFLFAFAIFGPPFIGFYVWIYFDPLPRDPQDPALLQRIAEIYAVGFGLLIVTFYFIHVATFAAYRYRLSRTVWRGIRGSVSGQRLDLRVPGVRPFDAQWPLARLDQALGGHGAAQIPPQPDDDRLGAAHLQHRGGQALSLLYAGLGRHDGGHDRRDRRHRGGDHRSRERDAAPHRAIDRRLYVPDHTRAGSIC